MNQNAGGSASRGSACGKARRTRGATGRGWKARTLLLVLLLLPWTPLLAETLLIGGTGAALGAMKRLAQAYQAAHPGVMVRVLPSMGTGGAIRAVAKGKIDLGLGGRPIGEGEKGHGLVETPYARSPVMFVVPRDLPAADITTEQIRGFYHGQNHLWPNGERCRPVLRPAGDSETLLLKSQEPGLSTAIDKVLATPGIQVTLTAQENAEVIGNTPGALGYTTLTLLLSEDPPLKPLAYNGVKPTLENLANGSYPFSKTLYLIFRLDSGPAVGRFAEFVKSPRGVEILRQFGNLPVE